MLRPLFTTREKEWILVFISSRGGGYAQEIADFFDANYRSVQRQLQRLESGGILASKLVGKTRLFSFNPRYPFLKQLLPLLNEAKKHYPAKLIENLDFNRRRPRRTGKPL